MISKRKTVIRSVRNSVNYVTTERTIYGTRYHFIQWNSLMSDRKGIRVYRVHEPPYTLVHDLGDSLPASW